MMGAWGNGAWCGGWPMGGFFMMPMMVIFWGALIVGGVFLFRRLMRGGQHGSAPTGNAAMETLKMRYAKGEITKEEFEQIKKDLE